MGYTHYWYTPPELKTEDFAKYRKDMKLLLAHPSAKKLVCGDYENPETPPEFEEELINFNGKEDDGHENFYFQRKAAYRPRDEDECFTFCKTARKPYDKVVCAALIRAKHRFGEDIRVSSDGDWDEWREGRVLYQDVFGETPKCPFEREAEEQ